MPEIDKIPAFNYFRAMKMPRMIFLMGDRLHRLKHDFLSICVRPVVAGFESPRATPAPISRRQRLCRQGGMLPALVIALRLGTPGAWGEAAAEADERLAVQIKEDKQRYDELFERAELESMAGLIVAKVTNQQFSRVERKVYALEVEDWLSYQYYSTYLTLRNQLKPDESFPVTRLEALFKQYNVVYQVLEELSPNDLDVLKRSLKKETRFMGAFEAAQATELEKQCQLRLSRIGREIIAHPQARWREHTEVMEAFRLGKLDSANEELLPVLIDYAERLGVRSAANWSSLGWEVQSISSTTALDCYETALEKAAEQEPPDFKVQCDVAESLDLMMRLQLRGGPDAPSQTFSSNLDRVLASLDKLQQSYPEGSSQHSTFSKIRQELNYKTGTELFERIDYAHLTRIQLSDFIGFFLSLKQGAPSDQAAQFDELISLVRMSWIEGQIKSMEYSILNSEAASIQFQLALKEAPVDRQSAYIAVYDNYVTHSLILKEEEDEKRRERSRANPDPNEWVAVFQDPRLIDQPVAPVATPASGSYQPGAAAPAQSTQRYCMTCSGTGSRTVWEDAYDTYSRQWGRQQVRKSCDRCGGTGTLR